jgi:DNA gyrase subunit A
VVAALAARLEDEVLLVSTSGVTIRTAVREIPSQGRDATGVRVMSLDAGAEVAAAATVAAEGS